MKLSIALILTALLASATAFNPFKVSSETTVTVNEGTQATQESGSSSFSFDAKAILDSNIHRPDEIYTNALARLKSLEDRPLCHRLAAQLLMDSCRNLDQSDEFKLKYESKVLQHHIDSFANGLTMCDMHDTQLEIPQACTPFTYTALHYVATHEDGKLDVSIEQVKDCQVALGKHHSNLMIWLHNRNNALLFCRASRLDMDKDSTIHLHKKLVDIMNDLTENVYVDLRVIKENIELNSHAAASYFEQTYNRVDDLKSKVHEMFESVTHDVSDVNTGMKSILTGSTDAVQAMRSFVNTMIQGNSQMAAEQESSFTAATLSLRSRMGGINDMVGGTEVVVANMKEIMEQVVPMFMAMHERQMVIEERSETIMSTLINATELLQGHALKLNEASSKASGISDHLDRVTVAAHSLSESVFKAGQIPEWAVRVGSPMIFVLLGNYGQATSLLRNVGMGAIGYGAGELFLQARYLHWLWASIFDRLRPWIDLRSSREHSKEWSSAADYSPPTTETETLLEFVDNVEMV